MSFNPLINYEIKENKIGNKKRNSLNKNQDHFNNMNPTELYTYKPLTRRTKINYSFSQINLPGNQNKNNDIMTERKKNGKKLFLLKNVESKEDNSRNYRRNKCIYVYKTKNDIFSGNIKKIIELDDDIISYEDM